jgi:hypothetical protein
MDNLRSRPRSHSLSLPRCSNPLRSVSLPARSRSESRGSTPRRYPLPSRPFPGPSLSPLAVDLLVLASAVEDTPPRSPGLFVSPGPSSPAIPSSPVAPAGVDQPTPWEQATATGGPAPSVKRQQAFDLMRVVESTGVERSPGSACVLCASSGARCFVSGTASTRKCSWCVYKAAPCSLVSPLPFLLTSS